MDERSYELDSFSLVGPGKLGTALAASLVSVGCRLDYVVARRRGHAAALCKELAAGTVVSVTDPLLARASLIFVTVPDDALSRVAADMAEAKADWSGTIVLHASGALDSSVLAPLRELGARCGSMHPMQTFTRQARRDRFRNITMGIEGDAEALPAAQAVADALGAQTVHVSADRKALYHAAAVLAGNYVITLLGVAEEIWEEAVDAGVPFTEALAPLARESLENAITHGPGEALTGPVSRGDVGTVRRQMDALDASAGHLLPLYGVLAVESVHMAVRAGRMAAEDAVPMLDAIHARIDASAPASELPPESSSESDG